MLTVAPLHASDAVGAVKLGEAVHSIVAFAPALPIVGACVSLIVIVWLTVVLEFPQLFVAIHVLVTVRKHELPELTSGPVVLTVVPPQASDAVGAVNDGDAVHSIVAFAPWPPIVGVEQITSVVTVQVEERPVPPSLVTTN